MPRRTTTDGRVYLQLIVSTETVAMLSDLAAEDKAANPTRRESVARVGGEILDEVLRSAEVERG